MNYLVWLILSFGAIRLAVAFTNWASRLSLPKNPTLKDRPAVSILIPARNEENNIGKLLTDLSSFDYNPLEILVYNDHSTDQTAEIIQHLAVTNHAIKLINGKEPGKDWLGKNFACHQLALEARGDFFLFLDADVRVKNGLIEKSLAFMQNHRLKLLSIFPKQIMLNYGVQLVVPIMNWILLSLLPLILVRKSGWKSFSAANGQFMMFDAKTYKQLLPHQLFKHNQVEDIAILQFYKEKKLKVSTLLGNESIRCSMYDSRQEAVHGFSKNIFQFFGGSMVVTIFFALFTTISPIYLFASKNIPAFIVYVMSIILIRVFVSLASKQSVLKNVMSMAVQHSIFLQIIFTSIVQHKNKTILWKDRNILKTD